MTDVQKQLLDPAIIGTTGILKSVKKHAPTVKRVVITSSFASIVNPFKGPNIGHIYTEADWNPLTHEQALENPNAGYRASKTFAEKAAWDFIEKEKPNFDLVTMCPPLVFGPIVHYLNSLDALNTSNQSTRNYIQGQVKDGLPDTAFPMWIDVRDLAEGHVNALEKPDAGSKRYLFASGVFSNKEMAAVIRDNFPEYKDQLPPASQKGGEPIEWATFDNGRAKWLLGAPFRTFETCIVDLVKSLKQVGA